MNKYSDKEQRFTGYIKKIVFYAKIDYITRKQKLYNHEIFCVEEVNVYNADELENECIEKVKGEWDSSALKSLVSDNKLFEALTLLTPNEDKVLFYYYGKEWTVGEIAKEMQCSERWIRKLKAHSLKKIVLYLEKMGD